MMNNKFKNQGDEEEKFKRNHNPNILKTFKKYLPSIAFIVH